MNCINLDELIQKSMFYHKFQPIMNLDTNKVYGFEALIRSNYFQNPNLLFADAIQRDKLFELDLTSVIKAINTFGCTLNQDKEYQIFVNVYPSTLINPIFKQCMQDIILVKDIFPHQIIFEINETEQSLISTTICDSITFFKKLGFRFALDDFGKGQSTIRSILEIEPDIVKVDRYFSKDLINHPKKIKVIELIIELCDTEAHVIIEGIENEKDLHILEEIGVVYGQGFLLGKPQAMTQIEK